MLNLTTTVAKALGKRLAKTYLHYYGGEQPSYANVIDAGARLLIERIGTSDALYHDIDHTIMVTLVGQDILRGRLLCAPVRPADWLHYTFALLCHDIGYVRGVCSGDTRDSFVINEAGERITLPRGASDAALTDYHIERGKIFVKERCAEAPELDGERLARAVELTRFPVPADDDHAETGTEAGLVRAADLIGQLADPHYLRKLNALYQEFVETGKAKELDLNSPADLLDLYPKFFWESVEPYIADALRYLELTSEGRQWVANLYSHVFAIEHQRPRMGPFLGADER
ncbi:MAG: metal-dependent phosphohydrolase [Alphaproteobacteria bacterium]|nr:metal-dependent phosphohydrolase [Alphaproteobacteria bacterium]